MSDRPSILLTPAYIDPVSPVFAELLGWPFADPFVPRLLKGDVPQRVQFGDCQVWTYRDPDGQLVGFGTLDMCTDWGEFTGGRPHPYIPLLAVNPAAEGRGHGKSIVRHLIDQAALLAARPGGCHDALFLDVYTSSEAAIHLYTKSGFQRLTDVPRVDPSEGGKEYIVMARRVSVASAPGAGASGAPGPPG